MLDQSLVKCADCINICNTKCSWPNYQRSFGYCELDNNQKYSICQNTHDDCVYVQAAHLFLEKFDENDFMDLTPQQIKLAKDNIVCEIYYQVICTFSTTLELHILQL